MFLKNPTEVLTAYLNSKGWAGKRRFRDFHCGRLAMALEIITQIKSLEALAVVTDLGRQEAISALQTLLHDTGLDEEAQRWYEMLSEWRKPKFQGIPVVADARVPVGTVGLVGPPSRDHPVGEVLSAVVGLDREQPAERSKHASASERPRLGPVTIEGFGGGIVLEEVPEPLEP